MPKGSLACVWMTQGTGRLDWPLNTGQYQPCFAQGYSKALPSYPEQSQDLYHDLGGVTALILLGKLHGRTLLHRLVCRGHSFLLSIQICINLSAIFSYKVWPVIVFLAVSSFGLDIRVTLVLDKETVLCLAIVVYGLVWEALALGLFCFVLFFVAIWLNSAVNLSGLDVS